MVFISLLAIGAVSAADDNADVAAVSDADDNNQVSVVVEKEDAIKEEPSAADSAKLGVADKSEKVSFGSGNGTKFDFSNMTFNINGTTFNIGDLTNGTFSLGNGTTFNISSFANGTFSFGNGTSFNISSFLNGTGNGTTFDISSFMDIFGGSKLTANTADIEKVYSGTTVFKATILESNKTVEAGKNVIFTINNKDYIERTDANGTATLKINLAAGSYYVYTEYNNEILAKNQIVIEKAASKITASAKTFKAKVKTKAYTVILKNNKNKAIKNAKVTLNIKGKTYTATTNSNGKATFKITKLTKKGKYSATVKFAGNGYYKASSKSVKITVN
ncbi:Ig-like domain repeat protein [Methanobrevibacter sp.]|uniref:Ig-like domain repeat protein n=1 Tax=Methanobrevibacter sp. TaxID=66852 RepID=UPI0025D6DE28|nr:Ig-like domain repeat protein [Methanobrevibacter sp.]MBQ2831553.1 hypothetical protein [Methanobrevibacter sp.]